MKPKKFIRQLKELFNTLENTKSLIGIAVGIREFSFNKFPEKKIAANCFQALTKWNIFLKWMEKVFAK